MPCCRPCRPKPCRPCRPKRRRRRRCCRPKKKCRGGRLTSNPFLNFLREYRKKHCGQPITKVAIAGAKIWCCMSPSQKCPYIEAARKLKCRPRRRRKSCC